MAAKKRKDEAARADAVATEMVLGLPPDEAEAPPAGEVAHDPRAASRLATVEATRWFLRERPEVRDELAAEAEQAWRAAGEDRRAYVESLAPRRAVLVSQAGLALAADEAKRVVAHAHDRLDDYMREIDSRAG